ncbi:hypothetical protein L6164_017350 [Bauhinia variegata]|uniref:Uncharacterized protein n=1 Tax=Bauhinia variegata TaxID=167791 RepID=A0ACB9N7L6_BAUVA|nr:hypothetical protein L6164_017350 [Bauhinia variegata]
MQLFDMSCLYYVKCLPVDALQEITRTLGVTDWKFDGDSCQIETVGLTLEPADGSESSIDCECPDNQTFCHVVGITLKGYSLPGMLPPELIKLPYLTKVDFALNYLIGTIPKQWFSMKLTSISILENRLSGEIPKELGNITTLTYLRGVLPCTKTFSCPRYSSCLHVNSGGKDVEVMENKENILYIGDGDVLGGTAKYFNDQENHWGLSSTRDFMDDDNFQNTRYTVSSASSNMPELYATARISPISLTYFHYCLENGNYTVNLHFAEIQFTNDNSFRSLGKRLSDVYAQERLVLKDFNIEDEANIAQKPVIIPIHNVSVVDNILEIRFYWACKGTTRIPRRGVYGPLISAFSIVSGVNSQTGMFSLKKIRVATNDFSPANKIGEGGFGPVYKGQLSDGTMVAIKQLSSKSRQACHLCQTENLMKVVDERLGSEVTPIEAEVMAKIALLCPNASPSLRPKMSEVVNMLEGRMSIPEVTPELSVFASEDVRFRAIREIHQHRMTESSRQSKTEDFSMQSQSQDSTEVRSFSSSSVFGHDLHQIQTES